MLGGSRNCRRTAARSSSWYRRTTCGRIPSTAYPAGGAKVPLSTTETFALDRPIGAAFHGRRRSGFVPGREDRVGSPTEREPPSPIAQNLQYEAHARLTARRPLCDTIISRTLTFEPPTPTAGLHASGTCLGSLNFIGPPSGQRGWRPPSPAGPVRSAWRRAADSPLRSPPLDLRLWHTR